MTAPLAKGQRITGTERTKLRKRLAAQYKQGASIRALATATGRSYGFIHRLLLEAKVPLRGRGGNTRGAKAKQ
jgi:transposase